jgi:hypothetical protein
MQTQILEPLRELTLPIASFVDETIARRAANRYLSRVIGIPFGAVTGTFIPMADPIWQFAIEFRLPRLGKLAIIGTIDVDAQTGEPLSLPLIEIQKIQDRANVIALNYSPPLLATGTYS